MIDWDGIVRDFGPMVFATAMRILGHAADSEDLVQDVFIEATRIGQFKEARHWGALLRRLTTYRALDRLRQRKNILSLEGVDFARSGNDPEENAVGHELAGRLRQLVSDLPEREASVFCLRYFEDYSYQEIAEQTGQDANAVGVQLLRARHMLRGALTARGGGQDD